MDKWIPRVHIDTIATIADFSQRCNNNAHGKPQNTFLGLFTNNDYHDLRILGLWLPFPRPEIFHVVSPESTAPHGVALRWRKRHR